ncbi:hypothetical protein HMP0721_0680 [Pseudoramibacter alactolyticus ATCC 23263]|uniref:Uncharacterized protein n=1 Tax=Pseudoramibacter alactolyticus ATCC 23263 TaxID=887929 RepID=E6MF97_9FIRM|nr:hypothetical protein HMP0721_0680 [Pseudoramibacter alactolyticus ATCC 23263]
MIKTFSLPLEGQFKFLSQPLHIGQRLSGYSEEIYYSLSMRWIYISVHIYNCQEVRQKYAIKKPIFFKID